MPSPSTTVRCALSRSRTPSSKKDIRVSEEDGALNYAKMVGLIPMPSRLEHRLGYHRGRANNHVIDWLSWKVHPGYTITQLIGNLPLAYAVALSLAKPIVRYDGP